MTRRPFWIAALLRLYPRACRERYGDELAEAMRACVRRERAAGRRAPLIAVRLLIDAASAGLLIRGDRASTGDPAMRTMLYDLRHSLRLLRRAPLFSALVVATLALAIGANTAIFSVVNGVLLRPLPYTEPDRLVLLYERIPGATEPFGFSAPDLAAFRERARSYTSLAAFRSVEFELSGIDQPERIAAARISASLMDVLGVAPALGRTFTAAEDTGRQPVAILSDGLWRRTFGGDAAVLGRSVSLDRRAYTIVGVMPPQFSFPNRGPRLNNVPAEIFVPISFSDAQLRAFGAMFNNSVVARLAPGVTVPQANAEAGTIAAQIVAQVYPAELREMGLNVGATATPMREEVVGNVRRLLIVLLAAVGVLLLIACADIACLMLTRAAARTREMAIRTALGAGRGRVMRLVLIETGVLAAAGGAAGLGVAWLVKRALLGPVSGGLPRAAEIALDGRVLAFTAAASICAALVCGLLPAFESSRHQSSRALKESGRSATGGLRQRRIFSVLVAAQFACAVVLLASGALLIRSFARLVATDPGFPTDRVVSVSTSLPQRSYPDAAGVRTFYARLFERVAALPGVSAVGASTELPLSVRERRVFTVENPAPAVPASGGVANDWVTGQYFEALGARVMRGRALGPADTQTSEPVVVINETLARKYFPGEDPVNRRLAWGGVKNHGPWMRIVGVIGDVKQAGLARETEPQTWQPWAQLPDAVVANNPTGLFRTLNLMVRTNVPPLSMVPAIRGEVRQLDPALPVTGVQTLDEIVGASASAQRFNAAVLGGFAGAALLLAAVGIAGVLAISVAQRRQEIGIRLALGAQPRRVTGMIVREGMVLVAAGLAIGLPAAFAAARLLRSLLFETAPHDAVSFVAAAIVLCAVAAVACAVPAVRASRVDPVTALRID
ncbi:MAG TPA: ABC transporter permease [Vicinamibacterales bacterium]|nr:ABC transporter permease [Vicinamibacterales bacterium]